VITEAELMPKICYRVWCLHKLGIMNKTEILKHREQQSLQMDTILS